MGCVDMKTFLSNLGVAGDAGALVLIAIAAYLIGSVSPSILISRYVKKRDVREAGSGNAGATNMVRVFGMRLGVVAFAGDILKTFLALLLGWLLGGTYGAYLAAAACFIGHCRPVYYHFRGGKGVACAIAIALFTDWRIFLVAVVIFAAMFFWKKRVSLSSITAIAVAAISSFFLRSGDWWYIALVLYLTVLVIAFHHQNIRRLLNGTEPEFVFKK